MIMSEHRLLGFGHCRVNAPRHEVWRDGQRQRAGHASDVLASPFFPVMR